ncbi:MAG: VCBS repeat-containing protein [Deltaproteobacteria bacterium]|nr:VCBS repeat-containing protein [Deltaproteobacteria bacterium]
MGRWTRLLLVVGLILVGCGPSGGGEDAVLPPPDVPDVPDVTTPDIKPDIVEVEPEVAGEPPALLAQLAPLKVPCSCPPGAPAGCIVTNSQAVVAVKAFQSSEAGEPPSPSNIAGIKLVYGPSGTTLASVKVPDPEDGLFKLKFDLAQHEEALLPEGETEAPDGIYNLAVEITSKLKKNNGDDIKKLLIQPIYIDRTGPKFLKNLLEEPTAPTKYADELKLYTCTIDTGCGQPTAKYFMGEKEVEPKGAVTPAGEPPFCVLTTFDINQYKTEFAKFKIVAGDCLGNSTSFEKELGIIGMPNYEIPTTYGMPCGMESARLVRTYDLDQNFFPDLVVAGAGGIAVAFNVDGKMKELDSSPFLRPEEVPAACVEEEPAPGTGEEPAPGTEEEVDAGAVDGSAEADVAEEPPPDATSVLDLTKANVIDLAVADMNGDSYPDLVVLASVSGLDGLKEDPDLKYTKVFVLFEDTTLFVEGEVKYWEPNKTWKVEMPEWHTVTTEWKLTLLRVADVNADGFPDVLVAGPDHTLSAAVLLHTGEKHLVDEAVLDPKKPGSGSPLKVFLKEPVVLIGPDKITDLAIGNFKGAADVPEIAFARGDKGIVTLVSITPQGKWGAAQDTILCFPGPERLVAGDIFDDPQASGVDDIVVTSPDARAVYVLRAAANGYFKPVCPGKLEEEEDFGLANVANVVAVSLFDSDPIAKGTFLSVGGAVDSMVLVDLVGKFGSGSTDSVPDLAVAVPEMNYIAIFRGEDQGSFSEALFVNPGPEPRGLITADFDNDPNSRDDLACLVDGGKRVAVLLNRTNDPGRFDAPMELPMPVAGTWKSPRLDPTHLEVGDLDSSGTLDLVVATEPELQKWEEIDDQAKPVEDRDADLALILSWLFVTPQGFDSQVPELPPRKSAVDVNFDSELTGLSLADFNNDGRPDLAVSQASGAISACEGRTFDLLLGGYRVLATISPDFIGSDFQHLDYYVEDGPTAAGRFRPLGGFAGLSSPSGIVAGRLDDDGLADVVLFGTDPNKVATYLTRWDGEWNTCAQGVTGGKKPWFTCSPPFPLAIADLACYPPEGGEGGEEEPGLNCLPLTGDDDFCIGFGPSLKPAKESDATLPEVSPPESGKMPIAAVVGEFYKDDPDEKECPDIVVLNKDTDNVTYLRGTCAPKVYKFHGHQIHVLNVGFAPVDLALADLDQDGLADIVVALASGVSMVYGTAGEELFEPAELAPVADEPVSPTSLVVEDVNADTLPDLLVTSGKEDEIRVWLNAGSRDFLGPFSLPAGKAPKRIRVADLDGDGCNEIAVLNEGSRTTTILRNRRCDL